MNFGYKGSCTRQAPGACKGGDAISCPGAFLGTATAGGTPINCIGDNAGVSYLSYRIGLVTTQMRID